MFPVTEAPPRVLFVIPGEESGVGSSMIFARRQAGKLAELGAVVDVFFLRSRTSPGRLIREFRRFRRMLAQLRPDVIHAHFGTMTAMFSAIGSGRTPLVITYRGSDLNPGPGTQNLRALAGRILSQLAALRASRIVCVSRQLLGRLWWAQERVTILPSGVDLSIFRLQSREEARRLLGWPDKERVVLFNAGHDPRNKRLDLARAAAEIAAREIAELRLEVLEGQTDPSRIPVLMNAADCLLVTSDVEGSPTVVQEALASNLPVVSVAVGDVSDRLHGVRHTRIAERDAVALARAVVELVREPLRTNGRERISEISSEHIAQELCRLYREARRH